MLELIKRKFTVIVSVPLSEHGVKIFQIFRLRHQVSEDGTHSRLELVRLGEVVKIGRQIELLFIAQLFLIQVILDPVMLQH